MVVLYWSWERIVCSSSRPGRGAHDLERVDGQPRAAGRRWGSGARRAAGGAARSRRRGPGASRSPRSRGSCGRSPRGSAGSRRRRRPTGSAGPPPLRRRAPSRATIATSERRCGEPGASVPAEACTTPIESSTVTSCWPVACSSRSVRPERREDQRAATGDDVRAVELGGDLHGEPRRAQRLGGRVRVGRGGEEVAAERDEDVASGRRASPGSRRRCRGRARPAA